jgi:IS30 family transposase
MTKPMRVLTEDEIATIQRLAPSLTKEQLAHHLGMCFNTLDRIMERDSRVSETYNRSRMEAGTRMIEALYRKGLDEGDFQSMKLYLSQVMNWTEKSRTEHTGADGKPIQMDVDTHWTIEVME